MVPQKKYKVCHKKSPYSYLNRKIEKKKGNYASSWPPGKLRNGCRGPSKLAYTYAIYGRGRKDAATESLTLIPNSNP